MAEKKSIKVVFICHGETTWDKDNRFCGWVDADLAEDGVEEAQKAGKKLKDRGFIDFDIAFTSALKRAIKTLHCVQEQLDLHWIPVVKSWRLNERHYGCLQGLTESETAGMHGDAKVKVWRRSFDVAPPPIKESSPYSVAKDPKYANLDKKMLPSSECLKDTVQRVIPFWLDVIVPELKAGKRVIVSAHGNSLRAIFKYLDNLSNEAVMQMTLPTAIPQEYLDNLTDEEMMELNMPTAVPLVYELDPDTLAPIKHYYLGSNEELKAAMTKAANHARRYR